MNASNPYAPPSARVADIESHDGATQPVRTWSGTGRIGRLRYLAHLLVAYIVLLAVSFAAGFVEAMGVPMIGTVTAWIAGISYLVFLLLKSIQRSHDMDWNGWSALLALIPFVNLIWVFVPGTRSGNRFGAPPPANTLGVKVLALVFPALFVIGIIAAVAIPAYVDYGKRVQGVQGR
jgi:uncharacterized membrane protein YhaH (DUF805 family)